MSVTVRFGARARHRLRVGSVAALRRRRRAPAVVYLAAARNTYGTQSYQGALQRVADRWPRAVVMDADAVRLRVARRLAPALALHPRRPRLRGGALGGGRVDQPGDVDGAARRHGRRVGVLVRDRVRATWRPPRRCPCGSIRPASEPSGAGHRRRCCPAPEAPSARRRRRPTRRRRHTHWLWCSSWPIGVVSQSSPCRTCRPCTRPPCA